MKTTCLLFLICVFSSCKQSQSKDELLNLHTTNIKQLMLEIDSMPIVEIEYQIEVDGKDNTIDTTSKKINKFYQDDKIAYSHNTRYSNDNIFSFEQYFIPNGEFIYQRTSSKEKNYNQIALAEIDSNGLVLGLTMVFEDNNSTDTIIIDYDYTFNNLNQREKLVVGAKKEGMNLHHYIHYKDNQAIREYDLANGDTTALSYNEYHKGVQTKSTQYNYYKGQLSRSKESQFNKDGNIILNIVNIYHKGEKEKTEEFTYKYNKEKRLSSFKVENITEKKTRYYKMLYVKQ